MYQQTTIAVSTHGRGTTDISDEIESIVHSSRVDTGLCNIFIQHTSASLMLCENADPAVRRDLEAFMARLAPDGDPMFEHSTEGPDDMPAHVRTVLTQSSLTIPVKGRRSGLGTWQGVYVWEHRTSSFQRNLTVTVHGETAD